MNVRSFARLLVAATFLAVGSAAHADPVPINGSVIFASSASPAGSANYFDSTGLNMGVTTVQNSSGDLAVLAGTSVTPLALINYGAANGAVSIGIGTLFTYTDGTLTYSLTLATIDNILRGSAANNSISLSGIGTMTITGGASNFAPTAGTFNITAGASPNGTPNISFSADAAGRVPEPATLALIGVALAGLGFSRRREKA